MRSGKGCGCGLGNRNEHVLAGLKGVGNRHIVVLRQDVCGGGVAGGQLIKGGAGLIDGDHIEKRQAGNVSLTDGDNKHSAGPDSGVDVDRLDGVRAGLEVIGDGDEALAINHLVEQQPGVGADIGLGQMARQWGTGGGRWDGGGRQRGRGGDSGGDGARRGGIRGGLQAGRDDHGAPVRLREPQSSGG